MFNALLSLTGSGCAQQLIRWHLHTWQQLRELLTQHGIPLLHHSSCSVRLRLMQQVPWSMSAQLCGMCSDVCTVSMGGVSCFLPCTLHVWLVGWTWLVHVLASDTASCLLAEGFTTTKVAADAFSSCSAPPVLTADQLAKLERDANVDGGRRLQQAGSACEAFVREWAPILSWPRPITNITDLLGQVGP